MSVRGTRGPDASDELQIDALSDPPDITTPPPSTTNKQRPEEDRKPMTEAEIYEFDLNSVRTG